MIDGAPTALPDAAGGFRSRNASTWARPAPASRFERRLPLLWRLILCNGFVLGGVLVWLVVHPPHGRLPLILAGGGVALMVNVLLTRRALASSDGRTGRIESARRMLNEHESERKAIARDLHDAIGQDLTAVLLQLARCSEHAPATLRPELLMAQETARASLEDLHEVVHRVRPEVLDDLGLAVALASLAERFSEETGLRVAHHLERHLPPLEPDVELTIYRVAQESLTNAARHAEASKVELRLEHSAECTTLRVRDDGKGLRPSRELRGGLRGMQERAILVGARLSLEPSDPTGLEVRLDVDRQAA